MNVTPSNCNTTDSAAEEFNIKAFTVYRKGFTVSMYINKCTCTYMHIINVQNNKCTNECNEFEIKPNV